MEENEVAQLKAQLREQQVAKLLADEQVAKLQAENAKLQADEQAAKLEAENAKLQAEDAKLQADERVAKLQADNAKLQAEKQLSDGYVQHVLNYTGTSTSTSSRGTDYRAIGRSHYFPHGKAIKCLVSGIQDKTKRAPQNRVICGHILASSQITKEQHNFDFEEEEDLHRNPRNFVFWLRGVEDAWTNNAVAFEWIEAEGTFRTWVLDKAYLDKTFFPHRYFHELHGHMWAYKFKSIANPSAPEPPFRRLMHTILMAGCIKARQLGVLPPGVNPDVDKLYFSGAKVQQWLNTITKTEDVEGDDEHLEQLPSAGAGLQ